MGEKRDLVIGFDLGGEVKSKSATHNGRMSSAPVSLP